MLLGKKIAEKILAVIDRKEESDKIMSMKKIFENFRKNVLDELKGEDDGVKFYKTPEEDDPKGADFPKTDGDRGPEPSERAASFLSFNPDPSDYEIKGDTHGKISHMIKHSWEIRNDTGGKKLAASYDDMIDQFKDEVLEYIKKVDAGEAETIYLHDFMPEKQWGVKEPVNKKKNPIEGGWKGWEEGPEGKPITQKLSFKAPANLKRSNNFPFYREIFSSDLRHPDVGKTTRSDVKAPGVSGPTLSNTLDYIQDKMLEKPPKPVTEIEKQWFEKYALPITKLYNDEIERRMKSAIDINSRTKQQIKDAWVQGKVIKFGNEYQGEPKTNYLDNKNVLIAQNEDGQVATMFAVGWKGNDMTTRTEGDHLKKTCAYLRNSTHPDAVKLFCAVGCADMPSASDLDREKCKKEEDDEENEAKAKAKSLAKGGTETDSTTMTKGAPLAKAQDNKLRTRDSNPVEVRDKIPQKEAAKVLAKAKQIANATKSKAGTGGRVSAGKEAALADQYLSILDVLGIAAGGAATAGGVAAMIKRLKTVKAAPKAPLPPGGTVISLDDFRNAKIRSGKPPGAKARQAVSNARRAQGRTAAAAAVIIGGGIVIASAAYSPPAMASTNPRRRQSDLYKDKVSACKGAETRYGISDCGKAGGPRKLAKIMRNQITDNILSANNLMIALLSNYLNEAGLFVGSGLKMAEQNSPRTGIERTLDIGGVGCQDNEEPLPIPGTSWEDFLYGGTSVASAIPGCCPGLSGMAADSDGFQKVNDECLDYIFEYYKTKTPLGLYEEMMSRGVIDSGFFAKRLEKLLGGGPLKVFNKVSGLLRYFEQTYKKITIEDLIISETSADVDWGNWFGVPSEEDILEFFASQNSVKLSSEDEVFITKDVALNSLEIMNFLNDKGQLQKSEEEIERFKVLNEISKSEQGSRVSLEIGTTIINNWILDIANTMPIPEEVPIELHEEIRIEGFKMGVKRFYSNTNWISGGHAKVSDIQRQVMFYVKSWSSLPSANKYQNPNDGGPSSSRRIRRAKIQRNKNRAMGFDQVEAQYKEELNKMSYQDLKQMLDKIGRPLQDFEKEILKRKKQEAQPRNLNETRKRNFILNIKKKKQ